ncbi:hypothetical protein QJS04_geneDACA009460 [Acorus gramineus]|uniref:ENT domain-containing protein n=1 Tax=Acorus gramineus TaxID=55184 RepID=A0AAV9AFD8_ACOGR|nr:hypothetical protein QJS04_geneDACA009460 [Acorus gramineus]
MDIPKIGCQIHEMEMEAYSALLRAFVAQSDVLSWDKEGLISKLRKELGVSDVEHREILGQVTLDDNVRKKMKTSHITMKSSQKPRPCTQASVVGSSPALPAHYRDEQWVSERNPGQVVKAVMSNKKTLDFSKGRGSTVIQTSKNGFLHTVVDSCKPVCDTIEIRDTNKLIQEIGRICGKENSSLLQIETARLLLKEQEQALLDAVRKLSAIADETTSEDLPRNNRHGTHRTMSSHDDGKRWPHSERYINNRSDQNGFNCVTLQDDNEDYG